MLKFKHDNIKLSDTMRTHLIDIDSAGIWTDDYSLFFEKRLKEIQTQLKERLIFKAYDVE
jgi:hypothetical protein